LTCAPLITVEKSCPSLAEFLIRQTFLRAFGTPVDGQCHLPPASRQPPLKSREPRDAEPA
jgi:hypothetical protein